MKVAAKIWTCLSYMYHIRSTADLRSDGDDDRLARLGGQKRDRGALGTT